MNAAEQKKLASLKKKLNCDLSDCIESIRFEVLETELQFVEKDKIRYRAKCSKCNASSKFNRKNIELLEKLFGEVRIVVRKNNYDSLFGSDE